MATEPLKQYEKIEFNNGQSPSVDKDFLNGADDGNRLKGLQEPINQLINQSNLIRNDYIAADIKIRNDLTDGSLVVTNATSIIPVARGVVNPNGRKTETVIGVYSTAFGYNSEASANMLYEGEYFGSSTAYGVDSKATGVYSTAIGAETEATGTQSTAIGFRAQSINTQSTAIGAETEATGTQSTAIGFGAEATGNGSTAIGDGSTISETNAIQLGSSYFLSALYARVGLSQRSDIRDKTDIQEIPKALDFINKIETIQYVKNERELYITDEQKKSDENYKKYGMCNYDKDSHIKGIKKGSRKRVGVKAQQVQQAIKEVYGSDNYADIVSDNFYDFKQKGENPSVENKLTVTYSNFIPFLIKSIQEQQIMIDELKNEIWLLKNK